MNLYDITQGRSTGIQVQAISRSGTNDLHGSTYGYFRSDAFNAADPVKGTVLPYEDQQAGFTLGGLVVKDKIHYFGSYEYERNPLTAVLTPTALPNQTWQMPSNTVQGSLLGRVDDQQSSSNSYSVRVQRWTSDNPFAISSGGTHPSMAESDRFYSTNLYGTWTHVVSNSLMMQVQGGLNRFSWYHDPIPSNHPVLQHAIRGPGVSIPDLDDGRPTELPELHVAGRVSRPARCELAQGPS